MSVLHNVDILCTNIRPKKILLDAEERAFISDFGLGCIFKSPIVDGTPFFDNFAAPEMWEHIEGNEPCLPSPKSYVWLVMASNYRL